jgi:succinyl-CoA synthetase alpha subunit
MIAYGTKFVAAVTPGRGGETHLDMPVFERVRDAVAAIGADASMVFVPPARTPACRDGSRRRAPE